jgi:hypothetical protein
MIPSHFRVTHRRNGKVLRQFLAPNIGSREGLEHLVGVLFQGETAGSVWKIGVISGSGYSGIDPDDTLAVHPGWTEFPITRELWNKQATVGGSDPNTTLANQVGNPTVFTFSSGGTVRGSFLTDDTRLWSMASSAPITILPGDEIEYTYQVTITG